MLDQTLTAISSHISVAILPIIIVPVTGICCLLFYTRLAAINSQIHNSSKEIIHFKTTNILDSDREKELLNTLHIEYQRLISRSEMIRRSILCCFFGLFAFILSAITIMLSVFWPNLTFVTLFLWMLGAIFFAVGLLIGTLEIKNRALTIISLEYSMIQKWFEAETKPE